MNSTFRTIYKESSGEQFKLFSEFGENCIKIIVLEKNNAWRADINCSDITTFADDLDLNTEEYFRKLKQYLQNIPKHVDIQFNDKELICYSKEHKMLLKFFSCKVQKIEFSDCVYNLIDTFSFQNEQLNQQNNNLLKEVDNLTTVKNVLEEKLSQFVNKKQQDDQELFSNFVLVLNEKKRRIQHLTQTLQAFKAGRPVLNPQIKLRKRSKKIVKQEKNEISESSESNSENNEYNTDNENSKKQEENIEYLLPIKSHNDYLFFEDTEDTVDLPKRKKLEVDNENFSNVPSTSSCNNDNDKVPEKTSEKMEDDSPKINFDTQDLLDCV
ncbi:DNA repair protein XRCC4-like [Diorhabda sublineata]|uniref:DNA repair protein XRCC4-like n=1 Tax=Diorhabda sublineata TaxID=1163346 RepID=UPI0024E0E806|nr:DNA repair protein XRCC4-like [Diorhabda sublineata]